MRLRNGFSPCSTLLGASVPPAAAQLVPADVVSAQDIGVDTGILREQFPTSAPPLRRDLEDDQAIRDEYLRLAIENRGGFFSKPIPPQPICPDAVHGLVQTKPALTNQTFIAACGEVYAVCVEYSDFYSGGLCRELSNTCSPSDPYPCD